MYIYGQNIKNSTQLYIASSGRSSTSRFYFRIFFDDKKYLTSTVWGLMSNSCVDKPGSSKGAEGSRDSPTYFMFRLWVCIQACMVTYHHLLQVSTMHCRPCYVLADSRDLSKNLWVTSQVVYSQVIEAGQQEARLYVLCIQSPARVTA